MDNDFKNVLYKFLIENTELSNKEADIASSFISALTITDSKYRLDVLVVMSKAIDLIMRIVNNEVVVDKSEIDVNVTILN